MGDFYGELVRRTKTHGVSDVTVGFDFFALYHLEMAVSAPISLGENYGPTYKSPPELGSGDRHLLSL